LPLLIVLENNLYAQSTSQKETLAGDISARVAAFGIATWKGDTWAWQELHDTVRRAVDHVRETGTPAFVQIDTYRLKAHSKGDDNRPREEVAPYEERDPLALLARAATPAHAALERELTKLVDEATARAESSPPPSPRTVQAAAAGPLSWEPVTLQRARVVTALNQIFLELMQAHPEMIFFGEDVRSPYGGAFKVSKDLSDRFPDRVMNTPISESAIIGIGSGLGLDGYRPFVEIMFGDFLGLGFDQILNHAAKFEQMYDGKVSANVVIRTPMGGGRGYGPTHSQTLDRHFFGIPGLRILALNNLVDPGRLYRPLASNASGLRGPTLVIENKLLYGAFLRDHLPDGFVALASNELFPTVHVRPQSERVDVTLVGYGGLSDVLVQACETLFEEHDLVAQAIVPMQVFPFDVRPLLEVLRAGSTLVLVEEGQGFGGFGAEILAQLAEVDPQLLGRVRRITAAPICIPASGVLEKLALPTVERIVSETAGMF
jgi:2-oxoisovalerate dehydrogenase E1 component